jgi:hypothetical protein
MQSRDQNLSVVPPETSADRPFERMSFSRQFLLVGSALLILGMAIIGSWLGMEIERSAVNRAAAVAAIYVESILAAQLRHDPGSALAAPATHVALDQIFNEGPLRRKVVRFKLWDADGVIRYSNDHSLVGQRFPVDGALAAAFAGTVTAHITDLDEAEHAAERTQWQHLLEVYVPVRAAAGGEVIAVAEFYHSTENLDRDIRSAQQRSWVLVGVATLAIFLLLFVQVHRANDTIVQQRDDLRHQLQQLRAAFGENERMRARLGEAGAATTTLNEQFLHRVAADLHDGPAQSLAFALMRFDEMVAAGGGCDDSANQSPPDLKAIQGALRSSLDDLRNIAAGLGMPGIASLSITETARRAVRDFERQFGLKVEADIEEIPNDAALATKITVYRLLQESMSNSHRHALGGPPRVRVWRDDGLVRIEVADDGAGFDPHVAARSGRLGLAFMLERVRLLGGTCEIESAPGRGTRVLAGLPLSGEEMS